MNRTSHRMETGFVRRSILIALLVLATSLLSAQQSGTSTATSKASETASGSRIDTATVTSAINGSYYRPDGMSGFDCAVSIDWPALFSALKLTVPPERLKAMQDVKVRYQSVRGKSPAITLDWTGASWDGKAQFEDGMKQMLGGFDQMYWSLVASPPIARLSDVSSIEPLPGGGAKVYSSSQNSNVVITIDEEHAPTHYILDTPVIKGTIDVHYVPSPTPAAGDLRRISGMDVSEKMGASNFNVKLGLDYQEVDGFHIPGHVSFDLVGAYSLSMNFSKCTASKGAIADSVK